MNLNALARMFDEPVDLSYHGREVAIIARFRDRLTVKLFLTDALVNIFDEHCAWAKRAIMDEADFARGTNP